VISLNAGSALLELKAIFGKKTLPKKDKSLASKCHSIIPMIYLLILKNFLKTFYSLTDSKCQSFIPGNKPEKSNKAFDYVVFNEKTSPFACVPVSLDGPDVQLWKKQFELFKELMKKDQTSDYVSKNILTPKRNKRKSDAMNDTPSKKSRKLKSRKKKTENKEEELNENDYDEDYN